MMNPSETALTSKNDRDLLAALTSTHGRTVREAAAVLGEPGRPLDVAAFLSTVPAALLHPEKITARAVLTLLEKVGEEEPIGAAVAAARAFSHPHEQVQRHAVGLVRRLAGETWPPEVRAQVGALSTPVRRELGLAPAERDVPMAFPPPPAPRSLPPIPRTAREIADAVTEILSHTADPLLLEVTVTGLLGARDADLAELRRLLEPSSRARRDHDPGWSCPVEPFMDLVRAVVDGVAPPAPPSSAIRGARWWHSTVFLPPNPLSIVLLRLHELAKIVAEGGRPLVTAQPSSPDGSVEPGRRLPGAEQPLERLLTLLRTPPEHRAESPLPRYGIQVVCGEVATHRYASSTGLPERMAVARLTAGLGSPTPSDPRTLLVESDDPLQEAELRLSPNRSALLPSALAYWPLVLPFEPDLLAAHWLPHVSSAAGDRDGYGAATALNWLATAPVELGPAGPAAFAVSLGAKEVAARVAAAEAIAARSAVSTVDDIGLSLAELVGRGVIKPSRAGRALGEVVEIAPKAAWQIAATALPQLLAANTRDTHFLLAAATEAAAKLGSVAVTSGELEDLLLRTAQFPTQRGQAARNLIAEVSA
ncbi:hypothetical protein SAMN05421504_103810 [Amycolatopsis xylanica]|uniref:Uncharacterized protein n=1 Tax=Amycolatopsis xylanica TaxID=589385 RepID=A0A1H3EGB2_9PSEU|nr:hypothetical protein [Amycolatopsis xylanica]SDX77731.1 hypothetical protein SAMN05421504_103810 [Amycolatopsis xylanica]